MFLALTLAAFWPQVAQHRALYWGDIGLYFAPMTSFLCDNLRAGRLPLWNPLLLCGTPFVGNPQTWPFYPFTAVLPLVGANDFLNLTIAFHVWLAACGTFVFLRRAEGLGARASLLGGVVFAFGGQLVSKEQFPNMVQAIAWLPWILYATGRLVRRGRAREGVWLGVVLGLQILAAHAQMTVLTLYLAAAYGVWRLWLQRGEAGTPHWTRLPVPLWLTGLVAAGLSAAQVLPTLELYAAGWRQKLPFAVVNRFYLPPNQLANFVLPALHGHPFYGTWTARGNFWETCCYVGWVPLALAGWGVVSHWPRRASSPAGVGEAGAGVDFWLSAFILGVWMALGGAGGLYHAAYVVLPGFRAFHDPARCLLWGALALSVLAGLGWEQLEPRLPARRAALVFALVLTLSFADLAHFDRTIYPLASVTAQQGAVEHSRDAFGNMLEHEPAFAAQQARLMAPDSARVWQRFSSHRDYRQGAPGYLDAWMATQTPNLPMLSGLPNAYGYEPVTRRDAQMVAGAAALALRPEATRRERAGAAALAGMLSVRTVAFFRAVPPPATLPGFALLASRGTLPPLGKARDATRVYLCENQKWQPRARLVTQWVSVATRADALALVGRAARGFGPLDLATTAVIVGQPGFAPAPSRSSPLLAPPAFASIIAETPDRVTVSVRSNVPCLLVLADTMHPGWQAAVDNHPARIYSADGFLRAVALPMPGAHRVMFTYHPTAVLLGVYLSLLTWGIVIAQCFARWTIKKGARAGITHAGRE